MKPMLIGGLILSITSVIGALVTAYFAATAGMDEVALMAFFLGGLGLIFGCVMALG